MENYQRQKDAQDFGEHFSLNKSLLISIISLDIQSFVEFREFTKQV